MTSRAALGFGGAVLCLAASLGEAQAAVTIAVDGTAPGDALEAVWAYYGYDEVNYTTTREGEDLLRTLAASHRAPVHVRTHFLFNSGDGTPSLKWGSTNIYTEDERGEPHYDYSLIGRIMDATVESGTFPLVELGFMPEALSTQPFPYPNSSVYALDGGCFRPPDDYDAWAELVRAWAAQVQARYPGAETTWQWELWNEPDIGYWQGSFEEYTRLYDTTEAALHAVLPRASLGGPAVADPESEFFARFLEHCAGGTHAVTGKTGTRLDMVSFHAKGGVSLTDGHVQMDLGNQLRLHRAGFEAVARSAFEETPIVISEADPDGCAACPVSTAPHNAYRNSPAYGAYEVAMMKRTLDLATEVGVDLRGVLTWAFTFPGSPYFAGYRALSTHGIHLPVLNAFKLLGSLEGDRLPVRSSGARDLEEPSSGVRGQPDIDALAAVDGDRIRVLVYHYHDELVEAQPEAITLDVRVPDAFAAGAVVTHRRVDAEHGNAYAVWESQGSPETPSAEELRALREAMEPVDLERAQPVSVERGNIRLSFELPRFGLSLLTLEPRAAADAETLRAAGCSCRQAPARAPEPFLLLALSFALARMRRRAR